MKIKKCKQNGFTITEALVSMVITMTILGSSTGFFWFFNKSTNRNILKNTMQGQMRVAVDRVEKELLPARKILSIYDIKGVTKTTSNKSLIMEVPLYTKDGFIVYNDEGVPVVDIIYMSLEESDEELNLRGTPKPKKYNLKITVIPDPDLDSSDPAEDKHPRTAIYDQIILKDIMPVEPASPYNYSYPSSISGAPETIFTYYDEAGVTNTYEDATMVRINLWMENEYSNATVTENKITDIKLRNFKKDN